MKGPDKRKIDRYAGLRPFIKEDRLIFFGRQKEIDQVGDGIEVNPAFILYGKSGLGKSSLVYAGLLPRLEKQQYCSTVIRFYNEKKGERSKLSAIGVILAELINSFPEQGLHPKMNAAELLAWVEQRKEAGTLLLVFDQFEEFLYYPQEERLKACELIRSLLQSKGKLTVKTLFLIRSDRFFLMKEVSVTIPGILGCSFELRPLTVDKAEEAIELPGQIQELDSTEVEFNSAPFEYQPEALRTVLETLQDGNQEIESSQLQIVCQELEEKAAGKTIITTGDFGGTAGIKEILHQFYDKQIKKLSKDPDLALTRRDMAIIRELIEDELVSEGKRVIQSETKVRDLLANVRLRWNPATTTSKVDLVIDKLLSLRLIREDDAHSGKVYEVSHDTLVPAIVEAKKEGAIRKRWIKAAKWAAAGMIVVFMLSGYYLKTARDSRISEQRFYELKVKEKYVDSIRHQQDTLNHLFRVSSKKQRQIIMLNDSLEQKIVAIRAARDSSAKASKLLSQSQDSLRGIVNQFQSKINTQALDLSILQKQLIIKSITIDTLKKRIDSLTKRSGKSVEVNKNLADQLSRQTSDVSKAASMVYKPSWFRPNYFLLFENIKVLLVALDKKENQMTYRLYEIDKNGGKEQPIGAGDLYLSVGQSHNFSNRGLNYKIEFNSIGSGGTILKSVFSSAAYITFSKL